MSVLASIVLTPLIVYLWSRAFPVRNDPEFSEIDYAALKKRNGWIDLIATFMMPIGLMVPFLLVRIKWVYIPIGMLGLLSAVMVWR